MASPKRSLRTSVCLLLATILSLSIYPLLLCAQASDVPPAVNLSAYVLGPGDQIAMFVDDLPEQFANKTFRVDTNGELSLPVIGHVQVNGLTMAALESEARDRLKHTLKDPQVSISLVNFGSQPISVLGAVNSPGIRQVEGRKNLFEILSASGGLRPDAGYQIKITRDLRWGPIPLPQTQIDAASHCSVVSIKVSDIIDAIDPTQNIPILPGDSISVPKADLVYVVGSVVKAGGFALNEHSSISALQLISLAEGLQKTAAADRARILRTVPGSNDRSEIALNLRKLMSGKNADIQLKPNDILFVPNSGAKVAEQRTIDILAGAAGAAIWRF